MSNVFCGREFTPQDFKLIHGIIKKNPNKSRYFLSKEVCKILNWYKADGGFKDMSCRVAMLKMHREELITLPAPKINYYNAKYKIEKTNRTNPDLPITKSVNELNELSIQLVNTSQKSKLWNEYIDRYHYLGHKTLPGAQLRYLFSTKNQYLGAIGFGASAWKVASRDDWIGWNHDQRKKKLNLIINNARFLIFPWVSCKNLATKILSQISKRIADDWYEKYCYKPVLLETFVEVQRFKGTCYKAANWINVGLTKGRGRMDRHTKRNKPIKSIWMYPLIKSFKNELTQ